MTIYEATVSVGIPTLNGPDRLDRCLTSMECTEWARFISVKIIVCDDGSDEDDLKLNKDVVQRHDRLRKDAGLEMLMNRDRLGIAKSWNRLTRHAATDVVVLVNDDIEVVPDWLDVLVYSVMQNSHAGMVGLNSYVGVTREALSRVHPFAPEHLVRPRVDYVEATLRSAGGTLLCAQGPIFAFRRDVFEQLGGFDERFFCFMEEMDFGVRCRRAGLTNFMADYPRVLHMGGATNSDPHNLIAADRLQESQRLFKEKTGRTLSELRKELGAARADAEVWNTQLKNWP